MRYISQILAVATAVSAAGGLGALEAQRTPDADAARIATLLHAGRAATAVSEAVALLRQVNAPQPRSKLDAIADTLAAIAIGYRGGADISRESESWARVALVTAASGHEDQAGVPYAGAAERLLRIIDQAQSGQLFAIRGLTYLPNKEEGIQALRKVAISNDQFAHEAISKLGWPNMQPRGLDALRDLYRQRAVTEPRARDHLEGLARLHGWN